MPQPHCGRGRGAPLTANTVSYNPRHRLGIPASYTDNQGSLRVIDLKSDIDFQGLEEIEIAEPSWDDSEEYVCRSLVDGPTRNINNNRPNNSVQLGQPPLLIELARYKILVFFSVPLLCW